MPKNGITWDGVMINAPQMHAPFNNCEPFQNPEKTQVSKSGKVSKKRKRAPLHTLTVDFQSEEKSAPLQEFREFIERVQDVLAKLMAGKDAKDGRAIPLEVMPLIKSGDGDYPDKMVMKFEPSLIVFVDPRGVSLNEEDIDFDEVNVEPTFQLHSFWRHKGVHYPRLVLIKCVIHQCL